MPAWKGGVTMAFAQADEHRSVAQINITPLVDVMLVLLVIFMVTAPVVAQTIPLDLPGAGPAPSGHGVPIRLRIDAAGQTYWNGDAMPLAPLPALLQAEAAREATRPPTLQIEASGETDYGIVAKVLAAARNAGVERIAFAQ